MKNPLQPSHRESESTPDNQLHREFKADLGTFGLTDRDYTDDEYRQNFASFKRRKELMKFASSHADEARIGKLKDGKLDRIVTADGRTRVPTPAEIRQVEESLASALRGAGEENAKPPPVLPQVRMSLDEERRFADWLPDRKDRKKAMKRIADDAAEMREFASDGRNALVVWRKLNLWLWLGCLLVAHCLRPALNGLRKCLALIAALATWLVTWH